MSSNGQGQVPEITARNFAGTSVPIPHDQNAPASFEEQLDRHVSHIARFGADWADRLVAEADRLVEEAESKRRATIEFADEVRRRAAQTAVDLKAGFERIRHAGRALTDARTEFNGDGPRRQ